MLDNKTFPEDHYKESQIVFGHDAKILRHFNCDLDHSINLGVSSLEPKEIKTRIEYFLKTYNLKYFLLSNTDVFLRDSSNYKIGFEELFTWLSEQPAIFIIQTLGTTDKKHADNVIEICYPYMFNLKPHKTFSNVDREYGFSFLNNYPRYFRLELGFYLWNAHLLDDIFYTQSLHNETPETINTYIDSKKFKEFTKLLPIQYEKNKNMEHDHTVNNPAFSNSYAHIYTETEIDFPVVTEKTFKPYVSGQIPIPLASKGHLAYLKSLGFHVFDDLLGQDYDYLDPYHKMHKIKDLVKKGKSFIKDYYIYNRDKIEHNNMNLKNMHSKRFKNIKF